MLINEVCQKCSLTKKAVEYYIEQELVFPSIQENGYRNFSDEDVARLKKIAVLRGLGLPVADIHSVLSNQNETVLNNISGKKSLEISVLQRKQQLIQELAETHDWEQINKQLLQLAQKQSILERLLNIFPGYYGRYICLHFATYLNEPIVTDEQQKAFDTIIDFLDNVNFNIPEDMQVYLDEITVNWEEPFMEKINASMKNAVYDMEKYLAENRETIETYMAYKQSDEYKTSPAHRLQESLQQFTATSGYNDVFLPAMRRLSKSYGEYSEMLMKANEQFLRQYPQS